MVLAYSPSEVTAKPVVQLSSSEGKVIRVCFSYVRTANFSVHPFEVGACRFDCWSHRNLLVLKWVIKKLYSSPNKVVAITYPFEFAKTRSQLNRRLPASQALGWPRFPSREWYTRCTTMIVGNAVKAGVREYLITPAIAFG
jgi:hypothetical protein